MKRIGKGILVVTVLAVAAILCSVASAGNVNPVTVTMNGSSVQGPGIGEAGPVGGDLEGTVDSYQEFKFYTNSAWHVEVHKATIEEENKKGPKTIGTFSGTLILEEGTKTGENIFNKTNREILEAIAQASFDDDFDPANWKTDKKYKVVIDFWLYSDDKVGNTYINDTIIFECPFVCKDVKPIDNLTMIWNGSTNIRNITVYSDKYDPKDPTKNLMYTIEGPIGRGDIVTATGYVAAKAPNDVDWLITFEDGTTGISRFHRSCSDKDMNGPEDCGKYEGNAKTTDPGFINLWLFEGMSGNGLTLSCTLWDGTAWHQSHEYTIWSDGETEIPEFTTIAIPVAGILGLIFLFSRRRKQK